MDQFDYILVGAGSAGCIVAERLSRDPALSVLLIEAGGGDRSPWVSLPLGYGKLNTDPGRTWNYQTEADAALNGREAYWPRGRLVGGSGSINAMVYCRGLPTDFDDWQAAGADGWNWTGVRPYFDRLETRVAANDSKVGSGPIHVQDVSDQIHPVTRHFFSALAELDLPTTPSCNGLAPEGGTSYEINTRSGRRCSSARAILRPALRRKNLVLLKNTQVKHVLFDGLEATGVELVSGRRYSARSETILCAGAIGSPQILQLSGIGSGGYLRGAGLPVLLDNKNVGGNLQDHLGVSYTFEASEPTLNSVLRSLAGKASAALEYLLTRKGPLALSVNQCGGFFRSRSDLTRPDQQLYFNPISYRMIPHRQRARLVVDPFPGFILCTQPARPTSRGRVDIINADPLVHPRIRPNSLATETDRQAVISGSRFCRKLMASTTMQQLVKASLVPGLPEMSDPELLEDFRARASTVYHPVSTCRMGRDRSTSVLDNRLNVHGVNRLRVVDASAFPNITSGNTNAPTMMLALKAADIILDDRRKVRS